MEPSQDSHFTRHSWPTSTERNMSFRQYPRPSARAEDLRRHTINSGDTVTISPEFLLFLETAEGHKHEGLGTRQGLDDCSPENSDRNLDPDFKLVTLYF
jgi:hypothetical protein